MRVEQPGGRLGGGRHGGEDESGRAVAGVCLAAQLDAVGLCESSPQGAEATGGPILLEGREVSE